MTLGQQDSKHWLPVHLFPFSSLLLLVFSGWSHLIIGMDVCVELCDTKVCSPSRSSLLTGLPAVTGWQILLKTIAPFPMQWYLYCQTTWWPLGLIQCYQMGPHFEMLGPHSIFRKCLFVPGGTNKSVGYLYRQVKIRTVLIIVFLSGIYPGVLTPGDLGGLPSHIPTLPSLLGERNYSSLLLGKTKSFICWFWWSLWFWQLFSCIQWLWQWWWWYGNFFQANGTWGLEPRGRVFQPSAVSNNIWGWAIAITIHEYDNKT